MAPTEYFYSDKYYDDHYEYRHVHVPQEVAVRVPKNRLMTESEWRSLGVQQSVGWEHYMIHAPERHVLLFRRPLPGVTPPTDEEIAEQRRARSRVNVAPQ